MISEYSEGKYFCAPSIFGQNLLNTILKYNAKNIYYLVNFESESYPYVIVEQNNKMYIYYDVIEKNNISYKIIPCEEYIKAPSHE